MKKNDYFTIEVTETLRRVVRVSKKKAGNVETAIEMVEEMCNTDEICLSGSDFVHRSVVEADYVI